MINFHKKTGIPSKVQAGHEDIWFSTEGIYVSANTGNPTMITAATRTGEATPTGVPLEPNILYFNTKTRKHYISTDQKWLEIPTNGIPGSSGGSGSGNAGNVMITDPGNWYTSNDVEGALGEIGEKLPYLLGDGLLPNYGNKVTDIKEASEYYLTQTATQKPSEVPAWLLTRKASNNELYGIAVDKNGILFSRVGAKFTKMATYSDINSLSGDMGQLKKDLDVKLAAYKIKDINAGPYIKVDKNPNGIYNISLSDDGVSILTKDYLKKTGDTATGNITIAHNNGTAVFFGKDSTKTNYAGFRVGQTSYGIYDYGRGQKFIEKKNDGAFLMYGKGKKYSHLTMDYGLDFYSNKPVAGGEAPFVFHREKSLGIIAKFKTTKGQTIIGATSSYNYLDVADEKGRKRPLKLGKIGGGQIPSLRVEANVLYANHDLSVKHNLWIGGSEKGDSPYSGPANVGTKLYLFPFEHNGSTSQRWTYVGIGWNASKNYVNFHKARKYANGTISHIGPVRVKAAGFIVASSESYKDIHGEFETPVLESIKKMKPYVYNYKNNSKTELGFVLERNVPKILQEGAPGEGGLNSYSLVAYLWKGVQELTAKVEALEAKI